MRNIFARISRPQKIALEPLDLCAPTADKVGYLVRLTPVSRALAFSDRHRRPT